MASAVSLCCPGRYSLAVITLAKTLNIPLTDLQVACCMVCADCYEIALELERYFPRINWSAAETIGFDQWSPLVYLAQQLYACAL